MSVPHSDLSFTIIETRPQDLQSICRTCLHTDVELMPIDSEILDISLTILSLLESCVALEVDETDDLPKQVCSDCLTELVKIHCFKSKCHQNENILKLMSQNDNADTISVKSEETKSASDTDHEEQSGSEDYEDVDNSILNIADLETDLENKVINVDDAGRVTVLKNASVQIIEPDPTPEISDNQLSSEDDILSEHQYSSKLSESDDNKSDSHIKQENEELEEVFECKICLETFTSKKPLIDHAKLFQHSQATKNIPKGEMKDYKVLEGDEEESGENSQCKICHENFTTRKLLARHAKALKHSQKNNSELIMCEICSKMLTKRRLREHMRIHTDDTKHVCDECGAKFSNGANLRRHVARHTGVKPHICEECGKAFASAFSMNYHQKVHTLTRIYGIPPYTCKICFGVYQSPYVYENHLRKKHRSTDSKSSDKNEQIKKKSNDYRCELCNKTFISIFTLRKHKVVHGEKKFLCNTCGKAFFFKAGLETHRRVHTGERPYKCHFCSKAFTAVNSYEAHMRIHTGDRPFACTLCSKKFRQRQHLSYHMTNHTGERLHQCTYCDKSFGQKINLTVHMRIHTGVKPYKCPKCEKAFYDSSSRRKHCIKSHGKYPNSRVPI